MIAAGGEEQATGVYVLIRSGDGTYLSSIPTEEKEAFPVLVTRSTEEPPQELETWQVLHLPSPSSASACFALMTYDGKRALVPKGYDVVVVSLSANEERRYEWQLADEAGSTGDKIDRVEQSIAFKSASEGRYLASSKETEQGGGQVLMDEKPFAWSVQLLASMEDCREHRSSSLQYTASLVFSETPKVDAEDIVEELLHGKGWAVIQDAVPIELIQETRRLLMGQTMVRQAKPLDGVHRWTWRAEMGARQRRVRSVLPLGEVFHHLAVVPLVLDACYKILGEDCIIGSYAGNILLSGCPAGKVHQDYPYWSVPEAERLNMAHRPDLASHIFEVQTIIALEDFTEENGATWMLPNSQLSPKDYWHDKPTNFWKEATRITCKAGSIIISNGRVWHASGANNTNRPRAALLGQYLSAEVKRMDPRMSETRMPPELCSLFSEPLKRLVRYHPLSEE
ncbi:Phytanoyl-CoA dioxygenase [Balamuthia mandrillaris]